MSTVAPSATAAELFPQELGVPFDINDQINAYDTWGANCGPGAIAGVLRLRLDQVRPHMGDFELKRYTKPTLMFAALARLGVHWTLVQRAWPTNGFARIQWEGPWTAAGAPIRARYRHTHWVGSRRVGPDQALCVFDINCMSVGGWVSYQEWAGQVVPWLLRECEPKATGLFHLTHAIEINPHAAAAAIPAMIHNEE